MRADNRAGWWQLDRPGTTDYAFALDGGEPRPDPRSGWQPCGVHGPSRIVDRDAFVWTDSGWPGRELAGGVIYELHVGTFTTAGTFRAAIERLDHLVVLGVDFVEVMPVNAFPGRHGWGYDGVGLYAVHDPYGGPNGLQAFVDACHARGLGVILDVVYNHLGPGGNYLPEFGPYFTNRHTTPWGPAINLDDEGSTEVRAFLVDNAVQWFRDYHIDGLRLDAVHAFVDDSPTHFLAELHDAVGKLRDDIGRPLFLIAESDLNEPRVIEPRAVDGYGMDAQWSDDFHHALHAALTGEREGYYADFGTIADIATALTRGYVYTGQHSTYRGGRHGRPLPRSTRGHQLVGYLQNHDQIGNRARGERISALVPTGLLFVGAALVLTSPFTPMLFMGEEWGASTPWQYFTDYENEDLARAVSDGRRAEFASFGWDPDTVPPPQDVATYERSRLDWSERARAPYSDVFAWYRELIRLRKRHPELADDDLSAVSVRYDESARWLVVARGRFRVACNLAATAQRLPFDAEDATNHAEVVAASAGVADVTGHDAEFAAQSVAVALV